jgi:ribosomal protein S18 acetylase RimI-like enzyme
MANIYQAAFVSLHVRKSNRAALGLYKDALNFTVKDIEKGYCEFILANHHVKHAFLFDSLQQTPTEKMHMPCIYH